MFFASDLEEKWNKAGKKCVGIHI